MAEGGGLRQKGIPTDPGGDFQVALPGIKHLGQLRRRGQRRCVERGSVCVCVLCVVDCCVLDMFVARIKGGSLGKEQEARTRAPVVDGNDGRRRVRWRRPEGSNHRARNDAPSEAAWPRTPSAAGPLGRLTSQEQRALRREMAGVRRGRAER